MREDGHDMSPERRRQDHAFQNQWKIKRRTMTNNETRIKVLQYMHGHFGYFRWSEAINRRYCERHGYRYVLVSEEPRRDRHICWHKVPVLLNELRDCDDLLFLDADAVFYSQELKVETELSPLLGDKSVLMAADCGSETVRWNPQYPNSGVIFVRNNDASKAFFIDWDNASDIDTKSRWQWPPEQLALWRVVLPAHQNEFKLIEDYYLVQGRYGQFIRHYCTCPDKYRVEHMQKLYQRLTRENC
jgi:hypothetical protein